MAHDGKTFEGENVVALRKENERLKKDHARLKQAVDDSQNYGEAKEAELREVQASNANLTKVNTSLKREAEGKEDFKRALKKARRSQRNALPEYGRKFSDGEHYHVSGRRCPLLMQPQMSLTMLCWTRCSR